MIRIHLFLLLFVLFTPSFMNAMPILDERDSHLPEYLKDLEELGYCVIPKVIPNTETELLYLRVWHEYIEKAWPSCRMDDRSNWKEAFPMHNKLGIFAGPAGQIQVLWDLRQDARIVDVFAKIWNTNELIVSMDGLSLMCPPEIREEDRCEPWPHVDQSILLRRDNAAHNNNPPIGFVSESLLKTKPFTVQGQFLFEDSFAGDGGFYCIPKSHLKFDEFALELESLNALEIPRDEKSKVKHSYLLDFFTNRKDDSGNSYEMKQITAPRGSLILWDSRTVHWNQHPSKNRAYRINPKVRMVSYLCYVPKARLTNEGRARRKEAFTKGVSTGHNPAYPELKYTKNHIRQEFERYLEDPNYMQPTIRLTPLGESLLGL